MKEEVSFQYLHWSKSDSNFIFYPKKDTPDDQSS